MNQKIKAFGYTETNITLDINYKYIWERTKGTGKQKEKNFIHNFSTVYAHETMHREIHKILFNLWSNKEEDIIDNIYGYEMLVLED